MLTQSDPKNLGLAVDGLARIDALMAELVKEGQLPGAAILIGRHGRVAHRSVTGFKDIEQSEPLSFETIFRIYSMTKPVTAAAMMILYDRGLWTPDEPIARHLPELAGLTGPNGATLDHPPTMLEILTHTAGFGYGIGPGPHDETDSAYIAAGVWQADNLADLLRRLAPIPLAYQPGSTWRYSLCMDMQGAVIERLSGKSLPDFMRSEIFGPLGMYDTDFYVPAEKLSRLATLYHMYFTSELTVLDHPGFVRNPSEVPKLASGGGGLYSTLDDYARFAQMLLNKGELNGVRILTPGAIELMTANHLPRSIIDAEVKAGFQKIVPGRGFAFNGAVFYDPKLAGSPVGAGTYQWDGASGVWFWIDPENDLFFVGMIQRMLQEGMAPLQELTQALVAEAIID